MKFAHFIGLSFSVFFLAIVPNQVSARDIFVSNSGSDTAAGTQAAPYKTFSKVNSVVVAGDNVYISGGTYTQQLSVTKSGTASARITVQPVAGQTVIIDGQGNNPDLINLTGKFITVRNFEVKNSNNYCVNITGQQIDFINNFVHDCTDHGIYVDGQNILIDGNEVTMASTSFSARTESSGWGSAMKVRVGGDNITFQNNVVYRNYGEGIAVTRGTNVTVRQNTFYDNFAVNLYIDNSHDVVVDRNFIYCTNNSGFEFNDGDRRGQKPNGIAIGEEQYDGWGAQLANVTFTNNIASNCRRGLTYFSADVSGGGLKNVTIAHNTFYNNEKNLSLAYEAAKQQGTVVSSNIFVGSSASTLSTVDNRTGIEMSNNYWSPGIPTDTNSRGTNDRSGGTPFATTPTISSPNTFRLSASSTAIGGGKLGIGVTADFEGKNRVGSGDTQTDMGAIEFSGSSGPLPSATPVVPTSTRVPTVPVATNTPASATCREDIDRDGFVDLTDYSILALDFLRTPPTHPNSDISQNGVVDLTDYSMLVSRFFAVCN